MNILKNSLAEIKKYPSAIFGSIIILLLVSLAIYAMISIPYSEAIRLWRGGEDIWYQNPKMVPPTWYNNLTKKALPVTLVAKGGEDDFAKTVTPTANGSNIVYTYNFEFPYDDFPQELFLYFRSTYEAKNPFANITLMTPRGEEIKIADIGVERRTTYRFSQDDKLLRRIRRLVGDNDVYTMTGLFIKPDLEPQEIDKGTYTLNVSIQTFEPDSNVDVEFVMHGLVAGMFGTDHFRRDLRIAMLWGAPIALSFGLLAALGTSVLSMIIAAFGAWYGGWLDELIQRITEVNLVLPFLAILIMVATFYSRSIWVILGVTIALSIFTGAIKTDRAIFLQVKESTYIEAAKAYGASNTRIIFRYLIPRIIPLLIPALVSAVPAYVFLEASLAVLGIGDPILPTWGKLINDAYTNGALYKGLYYWILEPAVLLMITGLGFAMLGFALDRIFNPRLREM